MIKITGLSKKYAAASSFALKEIDLSIPKGSVYGIIGMSGAGKSTLLHVLTEISPRLTEDYLNSYWFSCERCLTQK